MTTSTLCRSSIKNTFKVVKLMSYSLQTPSLPKVPLSSCTDEERKIQGKCWDLKAVQKDLQAGKLQILLTTKAVAEASKELRWSQVDVLNFFLCLETRHYQSSQWCLASRFPEVVPYLAQLADVHVKSTSTYETVSLTINAKNSQDFSNRKLTSHSLLSNLINKCSWSSAEISEASNNEQYFPNPVAA